MGRVSKALCIAAQCVLLVTCVLAFVFMNAGEGAEEEPTKTAFHEEEYLPLPTYEEEAQEQTEKEETEKTEVREEKQDDHVEDKPVAKEQMMEIAKADLRLSPQERVQQLLKETSLYRDGEIQYGDLLEKKTEWKSPYALIRFDELAYIYFESLKAAAPKTQGGKLISVGAKVEGTEIVLDLNVQFVVNSKILKFAMGDAEQNVKVHVEADYGDGAIVLKNVTVSGDKNYSDKMLGLGSDFLFGTEDYKGFMMRHIATVNASLGELQEVSATKYGVVIKTKIIG